MRRRPKRQGALTAICVVVALAAWARPATAQEREHRIELGADYREAGPALFGVAAGLTLGAGIAEIFYKPDAPWTGRTGGELRLTGVLEERPVMRRRMALAARILGAGLRVQAQLVDPALVVWAGDRNGAVAREMYAQNGLAFAVTAFVGAVFTPTIRRPRPLYDRCMLDPASDPACGTTNVVRSLVDTRVALAFTSAALTCTHHHQLPLYGPDWAGRLSCVTAATTAGIVGALSYLSDRQHVSDVLVAAALGVLAGFVMPMALGYGF